MRVAKLFFGFGLLMVLLVGVVPQETEHDAFGEIFALYDANHDAVLDEEEFHEWFEATLPELAAHEGHDHEHEHEHDHEEDENHAERHAKRVITAHNFTAEPCPLDEELFEIYDQDGSGDLNRTEAEEVGQQMMLMLLSGCNEHQDEATSSDCESAEIHEYWLAGIASTILVCLLSLVGMVLLPCMGRKLSGWQAILMMALIGFAAGALFGDAIFHILPSLFGAHSHDHGDGGHDHGHGHEEEEDEDDKKYLGLAAMVLIGVLLFFMTEKILLWIVGEAHSHGGSHTHGDDETEMDTIGDEESNSDGSGFSVSGAVEKMKNKLQGSVESIKDSGDGNYVKGSAIQAGKGLSASVRRLRFAKSYGWLNLVADAFHNFIDGIAIGASYSQSLSVGVATTIAVICHEIPQELGDYALIVKAGFGRIFALLFNLLSAVLAILGCFIGLGVGEASQEGDDWILAFTAGGFLYIALANMVPELHSYVKKLHWMGLIYILVQLTGFILGAGVLLLIAAFEDDIHESC